MRLKIKCKNGDEEVNNVVDMVRGILTENFDKPFKWSYDREAFVNELILCMIMQYEDDYTLYLVTEDEHSKVSEFFNIPDRPMLDNIKF